MSETDNITLRRRSARVEQKRKDAKQEILRTAENILVQSGIEAVTLAAVAGELGLTKQALYHYFSSKEALVQSLTSTLFNDEIHAIVSALEDTRDDKAVLGVLIRAFYGHYANNLEVFRTIYCQPQLRTASELQIDEATLKDVINPGTRHLFDLLEQRLAGNSKSAAKRARYRRLAFSAWLGALGLLTMLGLADATEDPLVHANEDLLETLVAVFDGSVARM